MALICSVHFLKDHLSLGNFRDSYKEQIKIHTGFVRVRPVGNGDRFYKAASGARLGFLQP